MAGFGAFSPGSNGMMGLGLLKQLQGLQAPGAPMASDPSGVPNFIQNGLIGKMMSGNPGGLIGALMKGGPSNNPQFTGQPGSNFQGPVAPGAPQMPQMFPPLGLMSKGAGGMPMSILPNNATAPMPRPDIASNYW